MREWHVDAEPQNRFKLTPFKDIALHTTRNYLVKGLIPREGLIVVWGPPKCGKTFLVSDLALHIALGWEYRGRRVTAGKVVYVACEGERGLAARIEAFRCAKMAEQCEPPDFYLVTTRLGLASDHETLISDIAQQIGTEGCDAIVIDTLNRSIEGSENDDADMGAYIKAADAIREAFNCAVIVIHHCGLNGDRPRGHTSLTGAADAQISVKRNTAGQIVATVEYMKDGPEGDEIVSALKAVEVGRDEDDEPITSCIIEPVGDAVQAAKPARQATGAAKVALDLLRRAIDEAGEIPPASNHIPVGRRCVSDELWRRYCYEGAISEGDSDSAKRKAFARSAASLQASGVISVWNGWVWLR